MRSYNSRVCGYPEAKPRENRKRGCYAERLTHALAIVYLTYTTQACAVFERVATRGNKKCVLWVYLIHTFGPIACIKSDVRWYNDKHYTQGRNISRGRRPRLIFTTKGAILSIFHKEGLIFFLLHRLSLYNIANLLEHQSSVILDSYTIVVLFK